MELQWVPHQDLCVPVFFFVIMKKFGFTIVLLNLNLLSVESMLMIHSYFFTGKNQHKNIKFTSETENEGSIAFLDIKITSDNNKFMTSVYHKPTFSIILTNFRSFIPKSYKYKLLFTLLHRAFKLCSKFERFNQEIDKLKTIFENNGYLKNVADFCIKKYLDKVFMKNKVVLKASKKELICILPFLGKKVNATENLFS